MPATKTKTKKRIPTPPRRREKKIPTDKLEVTQNELFWIVDRLEKLGTARNELENRLLEKARKLYKGVVITTQ